MRRCARLSRTVRVISSAPSAKLDSLPRVYSYCIVAFASPRSKKQKGGQRSTTEPSSRAPLSEWQPKHLTKTKEAMALLKDGVGLRRVRRALYVYPVAPCEMRRASVRVRGWESKWFCCGDCFCAAKCI